jgi:serine/threonine-protein kinase BUR1
MENTPDGTSPRTFALNHLRPRHSFMGCSRISDYELLGKLGEGTFGYDDPAASCTIFLFE